jgi:hypothetical protein
MRVKTFQILIFAFLFSVISVQAQEQDIVKDGKIYINDYFQNPDNFTLFSKVIQLDSLSQKEILRVVKNWAGVKFANLKYTLVSETDDQLVIKYLQDGFYTNALIRASAPWNITLIIQAKDGKMRYFFNEEGNAFARPGLFGASFTNNGEYFLRNFFANQKNPGFAFGKTIIPGLLNIRNKVSETSLALESYISKKQFNDNW